MKDSWQPDNTEQAEEQESKGIEENNQPDELELSSETETLPEEPKNEESKESITHKRCSRSGTNYDFEPYISREIYGETLTTIFIYTTFSAAILTASILVGKSLLFPVSPVNKSTYPTSIPWIKSKIDCEDTGRNWRNNKCWDEEHSASF
ncbi:hypothetical protein [Nostoc sp. UHCC 0870]|uniref:hypothetical protein n=1 Tax=Nostoc sp. UHCC 0870 TaxID=2914041 RepID=UPI001EDE3BC3|nr:hypothetical protein [Nostoc sp. UHCC 0870]UKO98701.1 hypothetical protein L6494_02905 [Nostoc sp. UHCC 0870]